MKFIANILTNGSFSENELYNVVSNKDLLISELPTLVIGWQFTKSLYPEANIIDWQIDDDIYWCFGKREKRNRYEESLNKFRLIAITKLINSIDYRYFNILTADSVDRAKIGNMLKNETLNVYINNDIVYINKPDTRNVIGISLKDIDYNGKSRQKMYEVLRGSNISVVNDTFNASSISTKMALKNKTYAIPYLFS